MEDQEEAEMFQQVAQQLVQQVVRLQKLYLVQKTARLLVQQAVRRGLKFGEVNLSAILIGLDLAHHMFVVGFLLSRDMKISEITAVLSKLSHMQNML